MKRSQLLNAPLSALIASLGHTDELCICDAGLPIPNGPTRIDLALTPGTPSLLSILDAILTELTVERVVLAEEIKTACPDCHKLLLARLAQHEVDQGKPLIIDYISHEQFKIRNRSNRAIVRSGEVTPYANLMLCAGVAF